MCFFFVFFFCCQLMLGTACGHVSERHLLTGGFLLAGGATAAVSLCTTPVGMAACASVAGLGASCVNPLLALFVADLFPPAVRASVVGLWQTSAQAGGIAANNGAGAMLAASGNRWQAVFQGSGLVVAAFAPVVYVAVQPAKRVAFAATSITLESATEAKGIATLKSSSGNLEPTTERMQGAQLRIQVCNRVALL
jgi:MFS family permease